MWSGRWPACSAVPSASSGRPARRAAAPARRAHLDRAGRHRRQLAASLRPWPMLVFEVTQSATSVSDGERLAYVPGRGFHRSLISVNGDVLVGEERLRGLLARAHSAEEYAHGLAELLGTSWDAELEPYRAGRRRLPGQPAAPSRLRLAHGFWTRMPRAWTTARLCVVAGPVSGAGSTAVQVAPLSRLNSACHATVSEIVTGPVSDRCARSSRDTVPCHTGRLSCTACRGRSWSRSSSRRSSSRRDRTRCAARPDGPRP